MWIWFAKSLIMPFSLHWLITYKACTMLMNASEAFVHYISVRTASASISCPSLLAVEGARDEVAAFRLAAPVVLLDCSTRSLRPYFWLDDCLQMNLSRKKCVMAGASYWYFLTSPLMN